MNAAPVIQRELRCWSRRAFTYRMRAGTAAGSGVMALGMLVVSLQTGATPAELGRNLFVALTVLVFGAALLAGPVLTADCLSEEKRAGTLPLLLLAGLRGWDIAAGKLVALSLPALQALLAALPILALSFFLGGVTAGELARVALVLTQTLAFSLCGALAVSAVSRNGMRAVSASAMVILGITALPALAALGAVPGVPGGRLRIPGPLTGLWSAQETVYQKSAGTFLASALTLLALAAAGLALASFCLPQAWPDEPKHASVPTCRAPIVLGRWSAARQRERRRALLEADPLVWLAARKRVRAWAGWALTAAAAALCGWGMIGPGRVGFSAPWVFALFYGLHVLWKVMVAWDASRRFAEDRDSGALELLLCMPIAASRIWQGWLVGLKRTYLGPVLTLVGLEFGVWLWGLGPSAKWANAPGWSAAFAGGLLLFAADLYTLSWVGIWQGVSAPNSTRACLRTMGWVLVAPGVLFLGGLGLVGILSGGVGPGIGVVVFLWFVLGLAVDLAVGGRAMFKLNETFREAVAHAPAEGTWTRNRWLERRAAREAARRLRAAGLRTGWRTASPAVAPHPAGAGLKQPAQKRGLNDLPAAIESRGTGPG